MRPQRVLPPVRARSLVLPVGGPDSLIGSDLTESSLSNLPKTPLRIPIFGSWAPA
jgi:hypothetical protein